MPRSEMLLAFNELLEERQLPPELVREALRQAIAAAYRKTTGAPSSQKIDVFFDLPKGHFRVLAEKEVVAQVKDPRLEVSLAEARRIKPDAQIGDLIMVDVTPYDFGRIAAQTARQVLKQRLSEFERKLQYDYFSQRQDEIVAGVVQAVHPNDIVVGLEKRAEGHLPKKEQIPGERFHVHDRIRALLLKVEETSKGPNIILSRAHPNFLRRLLEEEVPEIYRGEVEIRAIAREPGRRSKVAVAAVVPNIDPVGACVGIRGTRIQAIMRELNGEKIDVILWDPNPAVFITKALSPARVLRVYLRPNPEGGIPKGTAVVIVHENELSQAIGKEGQNVRLAAKLTRWRIDIKSLPEAAQDFLQRVLEHLQAYDWIPRSLLQQVQDLLEKKRAGRPLTPEEYEVLLQFLDMVEQGRQRAEEAIRQHREAIQSLREQIPEEAFEHPLDQLNLSPRLVIVLTNAGYHTVGDLLLQWKRNPDAILALNGIGPKAMEQIRQAIEAYEAEHQPAEAEAEVDEPAETPVAEAPGGKTQAEAQAMVSAAADDDKIGSIEPQPQPAPQLGPDDSPPGPTEPPIGASRAPEAQAQPLQETGEPGSVEAEEEEDTPQEFSQQPSLEELFSAERVLGHLTHKLEEEDAVEPVETPRKKKKAKKKGRKPKTYVELEEIDGEEVYIRRPRKREEDEWEEW